MPHSHQFHLREFIAADYPSALALWSSIEGLGLNESDTQEAVEAFLGRNPGFSVVALGTEGEIIGAVLCGHNGRAGSLHHLAVAHAHRRRGLGGALVEFCFARLADAGIPRCNVFVYSDNDEGNAFWLVNGWNDPSTWKVLQKTC